MKKSVGVSLTRGPTGSCVQAQMKTLSIMACHYFGGQCCTLLQVGVVTKDCANSGVSPNPLHPL